MGKAEASKRARRRGRSADPGRLTAGPPAGACAQLARWLPFATLGGTIILSSESTVAFLQGQLGALDLLGHFALAMTACFAGLRLLLGLVSRYERQRLLNLERQRPERGPGSSGGLGSRRN